MRVLYVSYDGALDPLGRSQVVPYLEGLSLLGHEFDLITFEKPERWADGASRAAMAARLEKTDISWHPLKYHKRFSSVATLADLARGALVSWRLVRDGRFDLLHARSYPPAFVTELIARLAGLPWIFDMRGLYPAERVEAGLWPADGARFRAVKRLEARFLRHAAAVVTLTEASVPLVEQMRDHAGGTAGVTVIPTAVDLSHFRPAEASPERFVLAYSGSLGTWYLLDEMLQFSTVLLRAQPDLQLLFLVNGETELVRHAAARAGFPFQRLDVRSVTYGEMPAELARARATIALIRPSPSKIASAATKVSESWAMGLPVVLNRGVGDAASLTEAHDAGVVVELDKPGGWEGAAERLRRLVRDDTTADRCRRLAERCFGLDAAVEQYDKLYRSVAG